MKVTEAPRIDKKMHLDRLLQTGTVMVILDGRAPGVVVPLEHQTNPKLPINLDYAFDVPDFKVLENRVEASLSFNRKNFFCILPLEAIYIMNAPSVSETVLFPEDVPQDLLASYAAPPKETPPLSLIKTPSKKKASSKKKVATKPHLKLVE